MATITGLAPHLLHHIGIFAGVAVVTGFAGTILFGVIGLAASVPLLLRLRRRFGGWRAPALALVVFAGMFTLSAFVIGPRISGNVSTPAAPQAPADDHASHHSGLLPSGAPTIHVAVLLSQRATDDPETWPQADGWW